MAARMSNKDRIARAAAEKQAADKEKAVKKKKKAATKKKTRTTRSRSAATKSAARLKAVWAVCDQAGATVKTFGFGEKKAAEKEAKKLTDDKGKLHFVKMDKVPME